MVYIGTWLPQSSYLTYRYFHIVTLFCAENTWDLLVEFIRLWSCGKEVWLTEAEKRLRESRVNHRRSGCKSHTVSNAAQSGVGVEVGEDMCVPAAVQMLFCLCGWCAVSDPQQNRDLPILNLSSWSSTVPLRVLTPALGKPSPDGGNGQLLGYLSFGEWWAHIYFLASPAASYGHMPEYWPRKCGELAYTRPGVPCKHCCAWSSFSASVHWLIQRI